MPTVDEKLMAGYGRAHARFLEDIVEALKISSPPKNVIEDALREQISHGKKLCEYAEVACLSLATPRGLEPYTFRILTLAMTSAASSFRELQDMVAVWSTTNKDTLAPAPELAQLIAEIQDYRAELAILADERRRGHPEFPPFDAEQIRQAREETDRGDFQDLGEAISALQGQAAPND